MWRFLDILAGRYGVLLFLLNITDWGFKRKDHDDMALKRMDGKSCCLSFDWLALLISWDIWIKGTPGVQDSEFERRQSCLSLMILVYLTLSCGFPIQL
jgi:hypothetical protein